MTEKTAPQGQIRFSQRALLAGGQPIGELMTAALTHPDLISLAAGFVDQVTLPVEPTQQAFEAIFADGQHARKALQYGYNLGHPPLREAILQRMLDADHSLKAEANLSIEDVIVTAGSNQLLHLLADSLFDPGDIVLCAAPTYFVYLGLLANQSVRSVGIETDDEGIIPEALEAELQRLEEVGDLARVKAIYVVSYFDNPASVSLSESRRPQIVEIAQRWSTQGKIHVIEDAAYRELRYGVDDLPSLRAYDEQGDTVIVAGTFSKSYSPGIRVGWGVLPKEIMPAVCDQKGNFDFGSPNLAQNIMTKVIELDLYDPHIEMLRNSYHSKLNAMLAAADEFLAPLPGVSYIRPTGGMYVWVTLPEQLDAGSKSLLFERATKAGMIYVPGEYCYPKEGRRQKNKIRLSFGVQSAENIRLGTKALAEAVSSLL